MDEAERQLLEYLASFPKGRSLVCVPDLAAAAKRLALDSRRLLSDVYEGPEGCVTAAITQAGREAIAASQ